MPDRSAQKKWTALFALWGIHGCAAFFQVASLPAESHNLLFGLPAWRLMGFGLALGWMIFSASLILLTFLKTEWMGARLNAAQTPRMKGVLFLASSLIFIGRLYFAVLVGIFSPEMTSQYGGYIIRLLPAFDLAALVSLEVAILILFQTLRGNYKYKKDDRDFIVRLTIILTVLGAVAAVISFTGLGIVSENKGDWMRGLPAVPFLEWQIILACLVCLGTMIAETKAKIFQWPRLDAWICAAIWVGTVALWLSHPVVPHPSALKPREPNFEVYPFIDAQAFDGSAQSALVGNGFGENKIPERVMYVVFLVFAHLIAGQDYGQMVVVQTLFLAMFPVLLYLLGKGFFGRPIGISIAVLAILRDYTANLVSPFTGNLSYSKLYLSETPTALLLVLFLLIAWRWIKSGLPAPSGFLMGGIVGVAMMIRTQAVIALPVAFFFAFAVHPRKIKPLMATAFVSLATLILVVSPWLWRNWKITGKLIFDKPESQMINFAMRYSRINGNYVDALPRPGESNADYNNRMMNVALEQIRSNPANIARGITNYFLNHAVNNVLLYPLRSDLKGFNELVLPTYPFWERWEGTPNWAQRCLLVFYVFLFGLGLTTAWQRNGWLGFLPLGLNLAYNLWTSLALLGGQRFMVVMDWSVSLYYMIGLFALLNGFMAVSEAGRDVIRKWRQANPVSIPQPAGSANWRIYALFGALFVGIGASIPISEMVFPKRYPPLPQEEVLSRLASSPAFHQLGFACAQNAVSSNQLTVLQGRALYPRYYYAGEGESFTDAVGYRRINEGRIVFEMVGQYMDRVVFPMAQEPEFFPNASDVTLFRGADGRIWFILVSKDGNERLYVAEWFDPVSCR